MYRGSGPKILPIIIVIVVVALVIAALVTLGRMVFNGGSQTDEQSNQDTLATTLVSTAPSNSVRWTVRGPIVAEENHRTYQITIGPSERSYTVLAGYPGQVVETKQFTNGHDAYEQFVYALQKAGVSKKGNENLTDLRGVCATDGLAFMFETLNEGKMTNELWTSTCKDSPGNLAANPLQIQALFVNQIPDFKPIFTAIY